MHLAHRPDHTALDQLHRAAVVGAGVDLRAHLRDQLVLLGGLGHRAGLVDTVRERLFAVAVLSQLHRRHANRGVCMVGRADHDCVDLGVHLVEHHAKVFEPLGLGEFLKGAAGSFFVDVAKGNQILGGHAGDIRRAAFPHADSSDVKLLVGRFGLGSCM